ncbi:MAG: hypothetical protein L0H73_13250 [Nitrococcus sp.]|nr:hypothetical protein [Nitrococcus sp.]
MRRSRERAKVGDEDWPPSLGEFRALCEQRSPVRDTYRALPLKTASPGTAQREIDRMRAILGYAA